MANRTRNSVKLVVIPTALRERRLRAFLSPEQLAERSQVGLGTIKAAEGSPKSVHLSTVEKLSRALGCAPSEIAQVETTSEGVA